MEVFLWYASLAVRSYLDGLQQKKNLDLVQQEFVNHDNQFHGCNKIPTPMQPTKHK